MKNQLSPTTIKIGILGGGQLGKMLYQAASPWALDVHILDRSKTFPAARVCPSFHIGDFTDYDDVLTFGRQMDLITIEIESVNVEALLQLEREGVMVYPQPSILNIINDKGLQKTFYQDNHLPTAAFTLVKNQAEILDQITSGKIEFPFVQKSRKGGYDGRGVQVIHNEASLHKIMDVPSVIEERVSIEKEIGLILARNPSGEIKAYTPVEMVFDPEANLVDHLIAPAQISLDYSEELNRIGTRLVEEMDIVGLLAVEFFIDTKGEIFINEMAPRTHNSGHHTIEACPCSQFEQQFRAILDFPLGDTTQEKSYAAMINILGPESFTGPPSYPNLRNTLSMKDVFPHIYGKSISKPNRKMGHITLIANDRPTLIQKINTIKSQFYIQPIHMFKNL